MGEELQQLLPGDILERIVAYLPLADLFKSQLGCKIWYRSLLSTRARGIYSDLAVREEPWVFTFAHCDKEEDYTALLTPCAYSLRSGRSHRLPGACMCPDGVGCKFLGGSGFLGFQEDGRLTSNMSMWNPFHGTTREAVPIHTLDPDSELQLVGFVGDSCSQG